MAGRRSPSPVSEYSVTQSVTYRSNSSLAPSSVAHSQQHYPNEPDAPPRRKKRGRSLSTTRLSSLDRETPSYAMAPGNPSFGYDRGKHLMVDGHKH